MLNDLSNQDLLFIVCALAYGFGLVKWLLRRKVDPDKNKEEQNSK
jgi:hypothetical protein